MGSLSQASGRRYLGVESSNDDKDAWLTRIASVLNNVLSGKMNNTSVVTLVANSATTTLTDSRIGANSVIGLMPTTANAAAALATTYFDSFVTGACTIHHANNAQVDKTFSFTITG